MYFRAKKSQKGAQNKSGGHKKQKKKVNMKILPRRGYEEVQEAPKTAKLLTSNHEAALNSSTPPGTAGPSTSTTTGTQMQVIQPLLCLMSININIVSSNLWVVIYGTLYGTLK